MIREERINPATVPAPPTAAILSLGSNLGDREATLRAAVAEIAALDWVRLAAASPIVETPALKPQGIDLTAPAYLNAVLRVTTTQSPEQLLGAVNAIENAHGRVRDERWGDRTLDIDIITFGELVRDDARLTLPHPRAAVRGFVLAPWLQMDPQAVLVGHGSVRALLAQTHDDVQPYSAEALL